MVNVIITEEMIRFFFRGPQTSCSLWATDKCHHHQSQGGICRESRTDKTTELPNARDRTRIRVRGSRNPETCKSGMYSGHDRSSDCSKEISFTCPTQFKCRDNSGRGRVSHFFLENWKLITKDPWIIQCVEGIKLDFVSTPYQTYFPNQPFFNQENQLLVDNEIKCL